MLLEFRVKNFRSLHNDAVLSFVASADKAHEDTNVAQTGNKSVARALRSIAIYGANASGKSNVIMAIQAMSHIVITSAQYAPNQDIPVQPFMLDPKSMELPTEFEMTFMLDGVRYQYGFAVRKDRVNAEWLLVYKASKPQVWFSRELGSGQDRSVYEFGSYFTGPKKVWEGATKPNSLFLSVATQLNSEQLTPVFRWISESLVSYARGAVPLFEQTVALLQDKGPEPIMDFLGDADISISDVNVEEAQGIEHEFQFDFATGRSQIQQRDKTFMVPKFQHRNEKASAIFEFADESDGTQKLFNLYGPLADAFQHGKVMIIDELDRSLHPLLVRQIVRLFQDPDMNPKGAQLVFTTHDTSLLDSDLLRRDQIWLVDKDATQSSCIYPLTDFSARRNEAFEKGYLAGRYGAVPILRRFQVR